MNKTCLANLYTCFCKISALWVQIEKSYTPLKMRNLVPNSQKNIKLYTQTFIIDIS